MRFSPAPAKLNSILKIVLSAIWVIRPDPENMYIQPKFFFNGVIVVKQIGETGGRVADARKNETGDNKLELE
jgi:hypothetical protein